NTADRLVQSGKPANDNRMTGAATADPLVSDDVEVPLPGAQKRTGTDDLPVGDGTTTGGTSASRTSDTRSTTGTKGIVQAAKGGAAGGRTSGGRSGRGGSGKGGSGAGDGTDDEPPTAQNDKARAIGGTTRLTLGGRRAWTEVSPPAPP